MLYHSYIPLNFHEVKMAFQHVQPRHVTGANVVGPDVIVKGEGPGLHRHPHDHEEIILGNQAK